MISSLFKIKQRNSAQITCQNNPFKPYKRHRALGQINTVYSRRPSKSSLLLF